MTTYARAPARHLARASRRSCSAKEHTKRRVVCRRRRSTRQREKRKQNVCFILLNVRARRPSETRRFIRSRAAARTTQAVKRTRRSRGGGGRGEASRSLSPRYVCRKKIFYAQGGYLRHVYTCTFSEHTTGTYGVTNVCYVHFTRYRRDIGITIMLYSSFRFGR